MDPLAWVVVDVVIVVVFGLIYVAFTSIYVIPPDDFLVSFFISTYQGVYVSGTYEAQNGLRKNARRGNVPLLRDIVILLWPFWHVRILPGTNVKLRYHASRIYTQDGLPVIIDGTLVFELDASLARFVTEFNVLDGEDNLAREAKISYVYSRDMVTGKTEMHDYRAPCLAQIVLDDTTDLFHEVCRKVAAKYKWDELRGKITQFEEEIRVGLSDPESRFVKSGMLLPLTGRPGNSVIPDGIDINFEDVIPADPEFFNSLSAPAAGKNRGIAEGNRIQETASRAGITGQELVRNESLRAAEELNVIAAGDSLSAVLGGLIAGRKNPKSGTSGKKTNPTSTPTP